MEEKRILEILEKIKALSPYAKIMINSKYSGLLDKLDKFNNKEIIDETIKQFETIFNNLKSDSNFVFTKNETEKNEELRKDECMPKTSFDIDKNDGINFSDEIDDEYKINVELPGFNKSNTNATLTNDFITIECKNDHKAIVKKFNLKNEDDEIVNVKMQDGVLIFTVKTKVLKKYEKIAID